MSDLNAQDVQHGYATSPFRDRFHTEHQFEFAMGWKECQRLGIEYVPAPIEHSNVYIRQGKIEAGKMIVNWYIAPGLKPYETPKTKYDYPVLMTDAEKKRWRAKQRRLARNA